MLLLVFVCMCLTAEWDVSECVEIKEKTTVDWEFVELELIKETMYSSSADLDEKV